MVAQNRTLCASAACRVSGLLRHRAVGAVTGLPADGVAGVIGWLAAVAAAAAVIAAICARPVHSRAWPGSA